MGIFNFCILKGINPIHGHFLKRCELCCLSVEFSPVNMPYKQIRAPPNTGYGMHINTADILPMTPNTIYMRPQTKNTCRLETWRTINMIHVTQREKYQKRILKSGLCLHIYYRGPPHIANMAYRHWTVWIQTLIWVLLSAHVYAIFSRDRLKRNWYVAFSCYLVN